MSAIPFLTEDAPYDEAINGDVPVLVDFTASWCGPCKQLAPVLEEIHADLDGRLKVIKVDVDEAQSIAGRYRIQGVPTMMLFERGVLLTTLVGAKPKRDLLAALEPLLA